MFKIQLPALNEPLQCTKTFGPRAASLKGSVCLMWERALARE